ncbi:MAG: hypothetical protein KDA97_05830 [Acidimicrobiales bacterium]|nr:hypothetical protein [Acidimicrobiales bacterium]
MTSDSSRHRLGLIAVATLSLFGALFARLWFLQVVESDSLTLAAEGNVRETVITPAPRGQIYDRNGLALVTNRQSIVVGIEVQDFEELDDDEQDDLLERLSVALSLGRTPDEQVSPEDLRNKVEDVRYSRLAPVPVAEDISVEDEIYFAEQAAEYPSVVVERTTVREYPYGSLAAHVLGYVGPLSDEQWERLEEENDPDKPYVQNDEIGKAGVEAEYEEYLRGVPGRQTFEVDRRGNVVREIASERVDPIPGDDLYLSIDARVQYKAEEALQAQLLANYQGREGAESGGLVVMDHGTGQVRAMASYPTYDPSELVGGISCPTWRDLQGLEREGPCGDEMTEEIADLKEQDLDPVPKLLNRAIRGAYPPASTFKLASAYAALKTGIRTPEDTISDPGYERLCEGDGPGCLKTNAGSEPHGAVDLRKALTVSSDVYFYKVGRAAWESRDRIGEDALQQAIAELGYGALTGIDLPGELPGQLPDPESEEQLALDLYDLDPEYYDNDPDNARAAGRWNTGFSADLAIGQKVNATPLQTANAYAALANGGTLYEPSVLDKVSEPGDPNAIVLAHAPTVIREIDFGDAYDDFIYGFRGVVDPTGQSFTGTAVTTFSGFPFGAMPLAGKTGTAQTGEDEYGQERPDNSLFVGFSIGGPTDWVATAMLEYSGSGGRAAAPAVRMVLEPIADGSIERFTIPTGGEIDAEEVVATTDVVGTQGSD